MDANDLSVVGKRPFFIPGGTLPGDAPSYVTRQADHNLLQGLRGGQFCYVLTSRQMGKSSLMVRTANRLREEGVAVAVLDLTALGQNLSVEQWYYGLLEQLGRHLRLEDELDDYWQSHKGLGPMPRWMAAIRDVVLCHRSQQITIFVDEIDIVRSLPFSTDEFFAAIRECYNRRAQEPSYERLTFCLLGVATPSDLIRDTRLTPFNIGHRIELTDFTSEEAAPLSVGISVTERDGQTLLNRVLYWTGGHPYLTQRLCALVAADTAALREKDVDRLCADLFLAHKARESDDNLQFVRNRLLNSEVDLTALLDLYAKVRQDTRVADDETNALTSVLKLSGIVRVDRGELKVRNRIYTRVFDREWVRTHMPDAEVRRQQVAYRQGLTRAGAVASAVVSVMGCLTFWAVQSQQQAYRYRIKAEKAATAERTLSALSEQQRKEAERTVYFADMKQISDAYEAKQYDRIGSLLEETKQEKYRPYRGFEWGYWNRLRRLNLLTHKGELNLTKADSVESIQTMKVNADSTADVHNGRNDQPILILPGPVTVKIKKSAYSPDGTQIVAAGDCENDKTVSSWARIWDVRTGRQILTLNDHEDGVNSVAYSPDGKQIVTGSPDTTARIWDARTGKGILILQGHKKGVASVAYLPDGKRIVTGSEDGTAKVWNAQTGQEMLTLRGHKKGVNSVACSPDVQQIVTGSDDATAKVWDVRTGRELLTLKEHDKGVLSVAFSPDGTRIVTGSWDNTAKVWDAMTGREILTLVNHAMPVDSVVFSPDSRRIVTGSSNSMDYSGGASIWDAQTGREILMLPIHDVRSVAFSPDGKQIKTSGRDDVKVWFADPID